MVKNLASHNSFKAQHHIFVDLAAFHNFITWFLKEFLTSRIHIFLLDQFISQTSFINDWMMEFFFVIPQNLKDFGQFH